MWDESYGLPDSCKGPRTPHLGTPCSWIPLGHPHPDHTGGLANLFFTMNKMVARYHQTLKNQTLHLFCPDAAVVEACKTIAMGKANAKMRFDLAEAGITDGLLYEDEHLRVHAMHNTHINGDGADGVWHAFSFLIEAEGKRILFTGDVGHYAELDALIGDGVDLLIGETGHHAVADACKYAATHGVKRLLLTHHGREVLERGESARTVCEQYEREYPITVTLCYDGMTEQI